ncbi:hypothetical protein MTR67_002317, partial [Solanum verrucosum]
IISIYGLHTIATRIPLWTPLQQLNNHIRDPWLIMGNFNSTPTQEDNPVGSQVQDAKTRDFRNV